MHIQFWKGYIQKILLQEEKKIWEDSIKVDLERYVSEFMETSKNYSL